MLHLGPDSGNGQGHQILSVDSTMCAQVSEHVFDIDWNLDASFDCTFGWVRCESDKVPIIEIDRAGHEDDNCDASCDDCLLSLCLSEYDTISFS